MRLMDVPHSKDVDNVRILVSVEEMQQIFLEKCRNMRDRTLGDNVGEVRR